ncbi:hypothetical protein N7462_010037 [Penicillium macrosclerotiorum]|uniref:uncharacterized protein n=1 Tax=Penicillium macrosclerotiorum TaxID=303699 RepID=UPI0025478117|nr:uncharacterized protein N7462_010037 [Penicillium macrosclerotiorum]KAJ5668967.1 hypothetical protein N7462_010037 [Penicillium macrosclerotiorum]
MLSFLAKKVPRTRTATQNPVVFDGGRASIEFKSPADRYLVINRWPPNSNEANRNIALRPPLHWHRYQTETFHVLEGKAKFTCDGHEIIKSKAETMVIAPRTIHTFCNASEVEELVIEFVLEPKSKGRDEAFFRAWNVQSYRDDCRKAGCSRSLPQLLLFNWLGDVVPVFPGPAYVMRPLGVFMNFVGGLLIGKYILGYRESYPEYYKPHQ